MTSGRRVLFASPVQPVGGCSPNVCSWDKSPPRLAASITFLNHPGLSFLKANVPCEILEYPTREQFAEALADPPEILGISFYINETELAFEMAAAARRAGVREVWAGNFGAYSPEAEGAFDRIFTGWSESEVSQALGSGIVADEDLRHPEMYVAFGSNIFPKMIFAGVLFTSRGCPYTCNFCQTPSFYGKAQRVSLEAIDRVLWTYRRRGIRGINILDENFGTFRQHAQEVVDLLHRHKMRWIALTRVDTLLKNFDEWQAKGLFGAHLGVESLNQGSLSGATKRIQQLDSIRLLRRMSRLNMFVQAFYILGFEEDTAESIRNDITLLRQLDIDVVQVQVLTPYPRTGQRAAIEERYGIHDRNLSRYSSRHLVWNHPHLRPEDLRELQAWANSQLVSSRRVLRSLSKLLVFHGRRFPNLEGLRLLAGPFRRPGRELHKAYADRIAAARQWLRTTWHPYEEVPDDRAVASAAQAASPLRTLT